MWTYETKLKLKDKIDELKNKEAYIDIKNIILQYNPSIFIQQNSNGILLYFHNLNESTYDEINKYITSYKN